jgi:hypothetical protein
MLTKRTGIRGIVAVRAVALTAVTARKKTPRCEFFRALLYLIKKEAVLSKRWHR